MKARGRLSEQLARNLLFSILGFMLRTGFDRQRLESDFRSCLEELITRGSKSIPKTRIDAHPEEDFSAAAVIKIWHRHRRFLDSDAHPLPLRLYGRAPSLERLILAHDQKVDVPKLIESLKTAKLIRRTARGRYLPTKEFATINQVHPLMVEHVSKSIVRLVETVVRNTSPSKRMPPLIERFARVPDLSRSEAKAFAVFTHQQGLAYLQSVDDWLETRRVSSGAKKSRGKSKHVGAGVHLYAYMGNESDDLASFDLEGLVAGSSRRSSLAARSGSRRGAAACTTSGVAA
jgi:hypothetical protein